MPHVESDGEKASTRTVDRALQLFTSVLNADTGDSLSELARSTDLSPSTASRLLATLAKHDLVQRTEEGRYRPGIRMKQLAAAALADDPLYDLVGVHLEQLVDDTHETASLGVPAGADEVLYLRQLHSRTHQVQTVVWTGRTIPRADTALGSALDGVVGPLGYLISRRHDSDVAAVASPIVAHNGGIPGAISINAPAYRTADDDLQRYGAMLVEHARAISLELGAPREALERLGLGAETGER